MDKPESDIRKTADTRNTLMFTFASGKGGVGKSMVVANLGWILAQSGLRTLIIDADTQFPNQHIFFAVEPPLRFEDIASGHCSASEACYRLSPMLDLLAGRTTAGSGGSRTGLLNVVNTSEFLRSAGTYDIILIDTAAGAGDEVIALSLMADKAAIVITDEPTSVLDGYGLIKLLMMAGTQPENILLLVNNVVDAEDAAETLRKINLAAAAFLHTEFTSLGHILYHRAVRQSIVRQELLAALPEDNDALLSLREVSRVLCTFLPAEVSAEAQ
jgi:flagellar biosynthesis protein FlhG